MKAMIAGAVLAAVFATPVLAQGGFRAPTTTCTANNNVCNSDCDVRLRASPDLPACHESCERRQADCLQSGTYNWRTIPPQTGLYQRPSSLTCEGPFARADGCDGLGLGD
jgi:hypothetical protein